MDPLINPFYGEYEVLNSEEQDRWRQKADHSEPMIRFKEHDLIMTPFFLDYAEKIHNFEAKEGDIWIISFPKAGNTWLSEMVWCLTHDLDFEKAQAELQENRIPFLEICTLPDVPGKYGKSIELAAKSPSPRTIKSHLPLKMLPKSIMESESKIIYVLRNPRDVCVSLYNHFQLWKNYRATFEEHVDFFLSDSCGYYSPYFSNIRDFVTNAHAPNILFITYESMKKDLGSVVDKVGDFLGKPRLDTESKDKLLKHLDIKNMRENSSVNRRADTGKDGFINKGIVGNWRQHLTPDMIRRFEEWEEKNLKDLELEFVYDI